MKKKPILIFVTVCVLTVCLLSVLTPFLCKMEWYEKAMNTRYYAKIKEVLEYEYDFTSHLTLSSQFKNLGFKYIGKAPPSIEIDFGFSKMLSIFGTMSRSGKYHDSGYIRLAFIEKSSYASGENKNGFEEYPLPEKDRDSIRNFLRSQYDEPESVLLPEPELPFLNSPVYKPHLPIMRWELEDRYLYLNDYPDIDVFEIRIQMK